MIVKKTFIQQQQEITLKPNSIQGNLANTKKLFQID